MDDLGAHSPHTQESNLFQTGCSPTDSFYDPVMSLDHTALNTEAIKLTTS